jgi:signal transduction histidine kinase
MNVEQLTREELIALLNDSLERQAVDRCAQQGTIDEQTRLVHELRLYQVELELQNRELRETQAALELSRDRERALHEQFSALDQLNVTVSTILTTAERTSPEAVIGAVAEQALRLLSPRQATIRVEPAYGNGHAFQVTRLSAVKGQREATVEYRAPMRLGERTQGELVARFDRSHAAAHRDLPRTLELVAERVALALEIARLNQQEARERARLDVLEQASRCFASCNDLESTRRALLAAAAISVPKMARFCVALVLEGERWKQLGVAHEDARAQRILCKLAPYFEAWLHAGKGRAAELLLCTKLGTFDRCETAGLTRIGAKVHAESMLAVPMVISGRLLGLLCFGQDESSRALDRHSVHTMQELAANCAAALERSRLVEELRTAVQSRETLLAIVSHDLRSPLNAIALTARALGSQVSPAQDGQPAPEVALIQRTVASMSHLVDDLLTASIIDGGFFAVHPSAASPRLLLEEAIALSQPAMRAKQLTWQHQCDELPEVYADRERVLQVFNNLLANAVKFSRRGGCLRLRAQQRGAEIEFCVADEGAGIPAHDLSNVFVRYWTARGRRSERGLGLYIAEYIVVAHGGRIWAESKEGFGASFYFTLPVLETMSHARPEPPLRTLSHADRAKPLA